MKKRLSIKARVTLWYTGLLILLLCLGVAYLLTFTDRISNQQLRDALQDVVSDAVQSAQFDYGELDDEDVDFYRDGVSVFFYDESGYLIAPRVNQGIQVNALLEDQVLKTARGGGEDWLIYDLYAREDGVGFWVRGMTSLSGTQGTLRELFLLALIGVPGFVLVAALGGWQITRRAFLPVGRMAEAANAITSGKDLSLRVPDDGSRDELSRLGGTVNAMLERLQEAFEREKQFTSDVSHELRTPTAVIRSQCEYALSPQAGEPERREALESVLRQSQRISTIISQLLLLARAENGKFTPNWERVNFSELCEMVALELEGRARERQVKFTLELQPEVWLVGDETLLMRLVNNLLTNAIRYNKEGGSVTLRLSTLPGGCLLEVADTGIGIRPEDQKKVWRRFYRVDAARSQGGCGLGLSMVQWIAQLHGGRVELESAYGVGSVFRVQLPEDPKK